MSPPREGSRTETVHATCLVLGEHGVLIRGASGAGKSTLALHLLDIAERADAHAALVGDDRVRLEARNGRLIAHSHPTVAGLVEIRGAGLHRTASLEAGVVRLVVDLVETAPRLPGRESDFCEVLGLTLPRLVLDRTLLGSGLAPRLVRDALAVASQSHPPALFRRDAGAP
ncbi:HPr kinase/phosphorylase [Methylobacterium nigriterrae]|uniref:HPr kinase/phosphorylase n=1 Tax=Methylobacterium nigriterrae TaxID=3127512 RepID=UPI0030133432